MTCFTPESNGTFNLDGEFITIEGVFAGSGSGLNISEVELLFGVDPSVFASSVTSFVPGASGYNAANLNNIIDGNINTSTAMGLNGAGQRMSVTVGFNILSGSPVPEPSSLLLAGIGIAVLGLGARRVS